MCLALLTRLSPHANLLSDGDTRWTIGEINKQHNPWRWFYHDWPIGNHFYRPIPTELFELDNWLHPHNNYAWGITCDILCILTTIGLFWTLRELTDSVAITTISTALFCLWQTDRAGWITPVLLLLALVVLIAGAVRQWRFLLEWRTWAMILTPALLLYWLARNETPGMYPLGFRMLAWIPGRTASSMTVFAFLSLGAFTRYMRLLKRKPNTSPATAYDTPNTRSTEVQSENGPSVLWPILSVVGLILALLCYEQAVMLPALLGLVGLAWHFRGATGRWWLWGIPFGVVLLAYVVARHIIIPPDDSWYFTGQKRTSLDAFWALQRYMFFFLNESRDLRVYLVSTPAMFLTSLQPWAVLGDVVAACTAFCEIQRRWILAGFAWVASIVAYGPMAWFRDYEHYHYFPMAFRAMFDVVMLWIALDLTLTAVSPRALRAPPRLSPAPGSLLHP